MSEAEEIMSLYQVLTTSEKFLFPEKGKVNVSEKQGVYIIYCPKNKILHVGSTKTAKSGLNQRLNNHLSGSSSFKNAYIKPFNIALRNGYIYRVIEVSDSRKRALLEALTAGLLCPAHFGTGDKKTI